MSETHLTATQAKAATLLCYNTQRAVAKILNVSPRTITRWRRLPAFVHLFQETADVVREWSLATISKLTRKAVRALHRNLKCGDPRAEIAAARVILDLARLDKGERDVKELTAAIESAEAVVREREGPRHIAWQNANANDGHTAA